jgi:hypothetical protein
MRYFRIAIGVLVVGIALIGCSGGEKKTVTWQYSPQLSSSQREAAQKVVEQFQKKCIGLQQYSDAVESAQVAYYAPAMNYRAEAYGWKGELEITLTIKQDAKLSSDLSSVAGHTLQYYVGSGTTTGILTQKAEGQLFYGMPVNNDGDSIAADAAYLSVSTL